MPRRIELELAIVGIALARNWLIGDAETTERLLEEVRRLVEEPPDEWYEQPVRTVAEGYAEWAPSYDDAVNPILQLEGPFTAELLGALDPGAALDAACGTGRQSLVLAELGHRVVGIDGTPEMLELAHARVPSAEFRAGSLTDLPVEGGSFDLAVCSLALTHLDDPAPAIAELARVVRPGGRVVISDVHPMWIALGAQAGYRVADKPAGFVVNHPHWTGVYLRAFREAGLEVLSCHEPLYGREEVDLWAHRLRLDTETLVAGLVGLPAVIVWELRR
jgi:ubiquinone/menaquinone biosynthesis C-methylase UbiE